MNIAPATTLDQFVASFAEQLNAFPGEHFHGDITGHGVEWRNELTIDYLPANQAEETDQDDDEVSLVFSLFEKEAGVEASLTLDLNVAEVGVEDRHHFDLSSGTPLEQQLSDLLDSWDMNETALAEARPLLEKISALAGAKS